MKQLILLVSLILLSSSAIRDNYKEQPNLADQNNPLSLTCPDYLPAEYKVSEKPNGVIPGAVLTNLDQSWYSAAVENILKEEYNISYSEEIKSYQSPNRANNLQFTYHKNGFTAKTMQTKIPLFDVNDRMLSEKEKKYEEIEDWSVIFGIKNEEFEIENGEFTSSGNKTSIENKKIRIDYTNSKEGMRQDFIVKEKISGDVGLQLLMKVSTELKMSVSKDAVKFFSETGGEKLRYASLKAWDANGKTLNAYFEKSDEMQFAIIVDDRDAEYPVTVDPISLAPDWTKQEIGTREYGRGIADAGDLNGDGYDDVVISDPAFIHENGMGRVYFYYGSVNGLPDSASKILSGVNGLGHALSSAGDVNNDGYDDIVIQAPWGDSIPVQIIVYHGSPAGVQDTAAWSITSGDSGVCFGIGDPQSLGSGDFNGDGYDDIIFGTDDPCVYQSHNVGAYVFLGSAQGITGKQPAWTASTSLNNFIDGMGWSASGAGDINADGYDDVIVGAPFHENTGKALVYYGSANKAMFEPADWEASDSGGYQMGLSVSSAGDVNNDGYEDIIVGSPPQGWGNIASGRAFIYFGSAAGLNGIDFVMLRSDPSIGGFGYSVSGVLDFNGDGFDDVAVGEGFFLYGAYLYFGNSASEKITSLSLQGYGERVSGAGDVNGDGFFDVLTGGEPSSSAFYGAADRVSSLTASTRDTALQQMNELCISTSVRSQYGIPMPGISVNYNVRGINQYSSVSVSDSAGKTEFCYTGLMPGYDTVSISYEDLTETVNVTWGLAGIAAFIKSVSPGMNANSAARNSDIQVEFVMNMNSSTINSSNIKVYGFESGPIPAVISYNNTNRTATINPVGDFKTGEKIQVNILSGIQTSDNVNITPFMWTFLTEAISGTGFFSKTSSADMLYPYGMLKISDGDLDSDGDVDAVALDSTNLVILKNNGSAEFTISQTLISDCFDFTLGDFNGDGDIDILKNSGPLELFSNDGNGNFAFTTSSPGGGFSAEPGDLDGDGDLDIICMNGVTVRWYLNDGNAGFTERLITFQDISGLPPFLLNLTLGDLDNDGDLDMTVVVIQIHTPQYTDCITYLNDGNANFLYSNTLNTWFIYSVHSDLDGDGDLDIVGKNDLYFNNGSGVFTYAPFSSGTNSIVIPADYDGDGDIDALFPDENSNFVKLFKNNSAGELSFFANSFSGVSPFNGTSADFDADGDIDLVIFNIGGDATGSNVSVLRNDFDCNNPVLSISGSSTITAGSVNNIYFTASENGYWNLINLDSTEASIPQNSTNDTVDVSAGNVLGKFELHYVAYRDCGGDTLLSKLVYVDNPLPAELAAFTSSVSGRNVSLIWTVSSELNNSGFEIERASDIENNLKWNKAGFVVGRGTSNQPAQYSFTDRNLETGKYKYRLKQIDFNGSYEYFELAEEVSIGIPDKYDLSQNYPNPFNPVTTINYDLPIDGIVSIKVYDILGREIKTLLNEMKTAGYHKIQFNAADLASGAYFYQMKAGDFVAVKKFVVLK